MPYIPEDFQSREIPAVSFVFGPLPHSSPRPLHKFLLLPFLSFPVKKEHPHIRHGNYFPSFPTFPIPFRPAQYLPRRPFPILGKWQIHSLFFRKNFLRTRFPPRYLSGKNLTSLLPVRHISVNFLYAFPDWQSLSPKPPGFPCQDPASPRRRYISKPAP